MPRLRLSLLRLALRAGALQRACWPARSRGALAESSFRCCVRSSTAIRRIARFQKSGKAKDARAELSSPSTFQPASGAGTTGFDSSGKRKAKGKGKSKAASDKAGGKEKDKADAKAQAPAPAPPPPLPSPVSRYGSPAANPYAPTRLAVPRVASGVARRGASPYYVAPDPPPDAPLQRRRPTPDETPFDPIGIQVGAFNFKPAIELTGGYDTNPARTQQATPSWYSIVAPELKFNSNWSRHEFTGDLRGSYYDLRRAAVAEPAECR